MKFVSFLDAEGQHSIGLYHDNQVLHLHKVVASLGKALPQTMEQVIHEQDTFLPLLRQLDADFKRGDYREYTVAYSGLKLLPPIQRPASCRDAYAFRQHVEAARRNRNVPMIPEFDQYPIFYFTNHHSIIGPGEVKCMPDHFDKLDFELEAAVVVGRRGRNITAAQADDYIFGYTILNDWSARTLQMEEMLLNLGPAKGKDFANAIGPMLVTPDELEAFRVAPPAGHTGARYNLEMVCRVNGKEVSRGNMAQMDWTFAEILERCAYGADIFPTDLIGSGTVGTGCLLELNGTGKRLDANYQPWWIKAGDVVEMEIDQMGVLSNTVVKEQSELSLLKLKHPAPAGQ